MAGRDPRAAGESGEGKAVDLADRVFRARAAGGSRAARRGWHVAYVHVSDMYGAPPAIEIMNAFHDELTRLYGLNQRAVLEGFSRGGLYAGNFALAHPGKTAALYLDAPVMDVRIWPGGMGTYPGDPQQWEDALKLFGLTQETASSYKLNAVDRAGCWSKARIPIIAVCGGADKSVYFPENTGLLEKRYQALRREDQSHRQARGRSSSAQSEGSEADRGFSARERLPAVRDLAGGRRFHDSVMAHRW